MALAISQQAQNFSFFARNEKFCACWEIVRARNEKFCACWEIARAIAARNEKFCACWEIVRAIAARNEKFCACWEIVRAIAIAKYSYRIQNSITISYQGGRLFGNRKSPARLTEANTTHTSIDCSTAIVYCRGLQNLASFPGLRTCVYLYSDQSAR